MTGGSAEPAEPGPGSSGVPVVGREPMFALLVSSHGLSCPCRIVSCAASACLPKPEVLKCGSDGSEGVTAISG